jgi:hypothetical protein
MDIKNGKLTTDQLTYFPLLVQKFAARDINQLSLIASLQSEIASLKS